jgi:dipeptidyl-peptidase-4
MRTIFWLGWIIFISVSNGFSQEPSPQITLESIWKSREFSPKSVSGIRSMKDGLYYTSTARSGTGQHIVKYRYSDGTAVDTLLRAVDLKDGSGEPISYASYAFNPDETKLLLASEEESIYRHSTKAHYYAFDIAKKEITPVTDFGLGKQQLAAFSPASNQVAFVRDNDLYISDLDAGKETRVTRDGKWGHIINGAVDWVYEEEFSFHEGFAWSPEGTKIAFYRFDEAAVPEFDMAIYDGLYPSEYRFKYPKAGERNSEVRVMVYDIAANKTTEVEINANPEQYIPRIKWTRNDDQLCIMRMNRHQNDLEFLLADLSKAGNEKAPAMTIYTEQAKTYIEVNDNLIFLEDGEHFVWNSEKDGWNHIYMYTVGGKEVAQITRGNWEVIEFYGIDQKNQTIFFSAAIESPIETAVYSASYAAPLKRYRKSGKPFVPMADMKEDLKKLTQNRNSNDAKFSKGCKYFINSETSAEMPAQISLFEASGKKIRDIELNEDLQTRLKKYNLSPKEFGTLTTDAGHDLNYWMIKPSNFDSAKTYPVMFMIYGGPGSNTVSNSWGGANYFWHQMLAQEGYIIVSVDPRGTMRRGRDFKHSTYLQLGKQETEDFIASAKYFGGLDYVDGERIGMMGWSYGGYMSSLCMTKGADYFKLGIAVAPVTNWRYYDTIYTERFMRTPQENPEGYDDNSPINFVDKMKGHYMLIHGSADDNVHYQNTMEMIKAMVDADKQFELFIYPNKDHGIYGGNTRYHLFTKMTDFIISLL